MHLIGLNKDKFSLLYSLYLLSEGYCWEIRVHQYYLTCFNILMKTTSHERYQQFEYLWGPNNFLHPYSWLQFADHTAVIAHSAERVQSLLNTTMAWCKWAEMKIRIDKYSTFGMRNCTGQYAQFKRMLCIDEVPVPIIDNGSSFVYLGKTFDFQMDNSLPKAVHQDGLRQLLTITSNLKVRPQLRLKILKTYIPSQIDFELQTYDISLTWIEQNLDLSDLSFAQSIAR